jgi:Domain of unknown function (DUF4124)
MRLPLLACLMLSFVGSLPQTVFAEIYKCKTAEGKVIYSERPCEGTTSQRLEVIDNSLDSSGLRRETQKSSSEAQNSSSAGDSNSSVSGNQETTGTRTPTTSVHSSY